MTFAQIAAQFAAAESGTDSFKQLYKDVFHLMEAGDLENAGFYFVIGVAAQAYVRRYEDEAVPVELANRAKATLESYNAKALQAASADAATRLRLLGEAATDYQVKVAEF